MVRPGVNKFLTELS